MIAKRWDIDPNASNDDSAPAFWEYSLGTKDDLAQRATTCALCRLIHSALVIEYTRCWSYVIGDVEVGPQDQIVVHSETDRFGPRLCIDALSTLYMQEFYIRVMNPDNRLYSRFPLRHPSKPRSLELQQPRGCEISVHLVREWLDTCDREHGQSCKWTSRPRKGRPLLFIDVIHMQLVEGTLSDTYVALSYVWGRASMLQSTKATVGDFMVPGGLRERLVEIPLTIRDAMAFTRGLGERYLWTDCLCIVQDDPASKHGQISQMDLVYSCAALTLVSLSGADANSGLHGVSPNSREPTFVAGAGGTSIGLVAFRPLFFDLRNQEKELHGKRAWTYQETILSRRCLYFNRQTVFFECRSTTAHDLIMRKNSRKWDTDGKNPLLKIDPSADPASRAAIAFDVYQELVIRYTPRKLSFNSDIVNAFTGLTTFLNAFHPDTYACGLPVSRFDEALCWYNSSRMDETTGQLKASPRRTAKIQDTQELQDVCPSWSWAGWDSQVFWFSGLRADGISPAQLSCLTFPHPIVRPTQHTHVRGSRIEEPNILRIHDRRTNVSDLTPENNCLHFWALVTPVDGMSLQLYDGAVTSEKDKVYIHLGDSKCGILYTNNIPSDLHDQGEKNAIYEMAVLSNEMEYTQWNANPWCLRDLLDLDRPRNYEIRPAGVLMMLLKRVGKVSHRLSIGLFNAPVMWSLRPEMKAVWLI